MLYSIVLVSAKHQYESAIGIHMSPPTSLSLWVTISLFSISVSPFLLLCTLVCLLFLGFTYKG